MKKITKIMSLMLAVMLVATVLVPTTAMAKTKTVYGATNCKYYTVNSETGEYELYSETNYKRNKKGDLLKVTRTSKSGEKDVTKYSYKKGNLSKISYSDGSYSTYSYKKNQTIWKEYSAEKTLIETTVYKYSKGKLVSRVSKQGDAVVWESKYKKGVIVWAKGYELNGTPYYSCEYDKYGNETHSEYYSYNADGSISSKSIADYTNEYKKKDLVKQVEESTFEMPAYEHISKNRTVRIYATMKGNKELIQSDVTYEYVDGVLSETPAYGTNYSYKFDKNKNVIFEECTNALDGTPLRKYEWKYKKFTY